MATEEHEGGRAVQRRDRAPTEAAVQRSLARYDLAKSFVPVFCIAAVWFPLQAAIPIAKALAGKHTSFVFSFSFSIAITVSIAVAGLRSWSKQRERRGELVRLRRRIEELESGER